MSKYEYAVIDAEGNTVLTIETDIEIPPTPATGTRQPAAVLLVHLEAGYRLVPSPPATGSKGKPSCKGRRLH
jgi:hypothetical protein